MDYLSVRHVVSALYHNKCEDRIQLDLYPYDDLIYFNSDLNVARTHQ